MIPSKVAPKTSKSESTPKSKSYATGEAYHLFDFLKEPNDTVLMKNLFKKLREAGIKECDLRLQKVKKLLPDIIGHEIDNISELAVDASAFIRILMTDSHLLMGAITQSLIIPKYDEFEQLNVQLFEAQIKNNEGEPSNYIPEYENVDPNLWGVSICTIDGQRSSFGDSAVPFPSDTVSYPFLYAKCIDLFNEETVHQHVLLRRRPQENFRDLPTDAKPYNPMVSSGAIALSALFCDTDRRHGSNADRRHEFFDFLKNMCSHEHVQINSTVNISHNTRGDKYRAMAYAMQNTGYLPKNTNIRNVLDFFFEISSLEMTCDSLSVMAATLANFGENPFTHQQVINAKTVKHVLSAMLKWGCTVYSGACAFNLGLPSKQSESGAFMLVVPGLLGLAMYSPNLNNDSVSPRNIEFAKSFVKEFSLHPFKNVVQELKKKPPFRRVPEIECENYCPIFTATVNNDLTEVMNLTSANKVLAYATDAEGRSILHVAAALGFKDIVKYVASNFWRLCLVRDRFERSPRDYVKKPEENSEILHILTKYEEIAETNVLPE
ncbi:hypothetical protein O3M35_002403 [Rhynocoris fuscipes]|uniref:glutaminase n=1 Tax=Rhynocoris fuscipes TaxID=488301 RepID=A0AAW1CR81_9HEMI